MKPHYSSAALAVAAVLVCAFSQGASADTVSITGQDYTGNAPLQGATATPFTYSGLFSQTVTGSISDVELSPYAFNTGPGADGSLAATNAPYSVLDAGGGAQSDAIYNVNSATFTLLWGSPDSYNEIQFFSGANGTGSLIGEFNGSNLACFTTTCADTSFDLATFTAYGGLIGSVELIDTGEAAFEYAIDPTPLPAALPLFATGLGFVGFFAHRRKKKRTSAPSLLAAA